MAIREVALEIKRWAIKNRMVPHYQSEPDVDNDLIRRVFGGIGVPHALRTLQSRGVTYVGINEPDNEIIVFTERKLSGREQREFANVTAHIAQGEAYHVTFMQSGTAHAGGPPPAPIGVAPYYVHNDKYTCGSSIYIGSEKGAGTLGCLVRDHGNTLYGLSNNHVTGGSNYAVPGLPILAPGSADVAANGRNPETIGHHYNGYPFIDGFPDNVNVDDNIDAAIFKIVDETRVSSRQREFYDTPADIVPLSVGMPVEKVGRTSGRTTGTVIAELVDYEPVHCQIDLIRGYKIIWYRSLFKIAPAMGPAFSWAGDSGSLIVTTDQHGAKKATGLLLAGNDQGISFALSLDRVLTYFNVNLVSGHNV